MSQSVNLASPVLISAETGVVLAVVWAFSYPLVTVQEAGLDYAHSMDFGIYSSELQF